jgi:DNA sulfur modification protein DndB
MGYISNEKVLDIKEKITSDLSYLGKLYKAKKKDYLELSIDHNLVENYEKDGWEINEVLKTKTKIRKPKPHSKLFEDQIWCQFYELGFRTLNIDDNFKLPFSNDDTDKKQIDVVAINHETAIIIECKSSEKLKKAPSYKDEFDLLSLRLSGFRKVIHQVFGNELKLKFIFATRNLRISAESDDIKRLTSTSSYHHNDNSFEYVKSLIKNYKGAARYQFMGLVFKGERINNNKIEVPAVEGDMGGLKYYMFSIEPGILLKMGFVLHRTKANEEEMPTYQRLLIPSRLKGIKEFIDGGDGKESGFFPNSIIVNFNTEKNKLIFEPLAARGTSSSSSRAGILKLSNAYSIAYVIDGQHRLYGYAESKFKDTNTIPVVAFKDLPSIKQLEMFMDINQNQKAVSPSLRLTLEKDLFWDSDRVDSRIKALRSSVVQRLGTDQSSLLLNKIQIGEDSALLSSKPFSTALTTSGLLPTAKGNKYLDTNLEACLYDTNNNNHNQEMRRAEKNIYSLINLCYEFVEANYSKIFHQDKSLIVSNRGTYAFINIIGSLNSHLIASNTLKKSDTPEARFSAIEKYLAALLNAIENISPEKNKTLVEVQGKSAETIWLRNFQEMINSKFHDYNPVELVEWKERNDVALQATARQYAHEIEKFMKETVLNNVQLLFKDNWELEINSIKRICLDRAEKEKERLYKELNEVQEIEWTEMMNINDYKAIIEKNWTKKVDENTPTFEKIFSLDIGLGDFNSKTDKTKWIAKLNSMRNTIAHSATKNDGLSKEEVALLKVMRDHCLNQ